MLRYISFIVKIGTFKYFYYTRKLEKNFIKFCKFILGNQVSGKVGQNCKHSDRLSFREILGLQSRKSG